MIKLDKKIKLHQIIMNEIKEEKNNKKHKSNKTNRNKLIKTKLDIRNK